MKIPILGNHHKIEFPMDRSHPKHVRIEYIQGIQIYPQNYHHNGLDIDGDQDNDNIADWVEEIATDNWAWFTRGYTGHEMLPEFGLINMNGRAYDPVLGRMLQVDNYIQNPFSSQSYNRYSYVLNNPMKYVDPSGEFVHIIIGAAIGGVVNWGMHGFKLDAEGAAAFGIGALAGGVGAATGGASFLAAGGGVLGAGGFAAGAVSGMVGSAVSMPILSIGNHVAFNDPLMTGKQYVTGILIGGLVGGIINGGIAKYHGKRFWNGGAKPTVGLGGGSGLRPYIEVDPSDLKMGNTEVENLKWVDGKWVESVGSTVNENFETIYLGVNEQLPHSARQIGQTWHTWGADDFQSQFLAKISDANVRINFELADKYGNMINVNSAIQEGSVGLGVGTTRVTSWELFQIYSSPNALNRTTFYLNGIQVPSPF